VGRRLNRSFFLGPGWPYLLVPFIPIAVVLSIAGVSDVVVFFTSALGIIPTASLMSTATEELAARSGPGIGGLLNVTFGNAPELIIALFALGQGLHEVVKATLVGSILGNVLLVMGASMLAGGIGREKQTFDHTAASVQTTMLLIAAAAGVMLAAFQLVGGGTLPQPSDEIVNFGGSVEHLSLAIAVVLIVTYGVGLLFSLKTHRDLFNPPDEIDADDEDTLGWSVRTSVIMLAVAGIAVGVMSEVLVHSIVAASQSIGLSEFFIGAVIVAIVGNAAEHWVAVVVARKDKMDLSINIAIGSSAQIGLFVAPLLVLVSFFVGPHPMPFVLNGLEVGALLFAALIANYVSSEGESTWFEGVQLLAIYLLIALVFGFA
jgi:Ca2+:H+ antiporter